MLCESHILLNNPTIKTIKICWFVGKNKMFTISEETITTSLSSSPNVQYYATENSTTCLHSVEPFVANDIDIKHLIPANIRINCTHLYTRILNETYYNKILLIIGLRTQEYITIVEGWYRPMIRNIIYCKQHTLNVTDRVSFIDTGRLHLKFNEMAHAIIERLICNMTCLFPVNMKCAWTN